jgi:hypothetical protein
VKEIDDDESNVAAGEYEQWAESLESADEVRLLDFKVEHSASLKQFSQAAVGLGRVACG